MKQNLGFNTESKLLKNEHCKTLHFSEVITNSGAFINFVLCNLIIAFFGVLMHFQENKKPLILLKFSGFYFLLF